MDASVHNSFYFSVVMSSKFVKLSKLCPFKGLSKEQLTDKLKVSLQSEQRFRELCTCQDKELVVSDLKERLKQLTAAKINVEIDRATENKQKDVLISNLQLELLGANANLLSEIKNADAQKKRLVQEGKELQSKMENFQIVTLQQQQLKIHVDELMTFKNDASVQMEQKDEQLKMKENDARQMQRELNNERKTTRSLEDQVQILERQKAVLLAQVETHKTQMSELNKDLDACVLGKKEAIDELDDLRDTLVKASVENKSMQRSMNKQDFDLTQLQTEHHDLTVEFKIFQKEAEDKLKFITTESDRHYMALLSDRNVLQESVNEILVERDENKELAEDFRKRFTRAERLINTQKLEVQDAVFHKSLIRERIIVTRLEIDMKQHKIEFLNDKLIEKNDVFREKQSAIVQCLARNQLKLGKVRMQHKENNMLLNKRNVELEATTNVLNQLKEQQEQTTKELAVANAKLSDLVNTERSQKIKLHHLLKELSQKTLELQQVYSQLKGIKHQLADSNAHNLEKEVKLLRSLQDMGGEKATISNDLQNHKEMLLRHTRTHLSDNERQQVLNSNLKHEVKNQRRCLETHQKLITWLQMKLVKAGDGQTFTCKFEGDAKKLGKNFYVKDLNFGTVQLIKFLDPEQKKSELFIQLSCKNKKLKDNEASMKKKDEEIETLKQKLAMRPAEAVENLRLCKRENEKLRTKIRGLNLHVMALQYKVKCLQNGIVQLEGEDMNSLSERSTCKSTAIGQLDIPKRFQVQTEDESS